MLFREAGGIDKNQSCDTSEDAVSYPEGAQRLYIRKGAAVRFLPLKVCFCWFGEQFIGTNRYRHEGPVPNGSHDTPANQYSGIVEVRGIR